MSAMKDLEMRFAELVKSHSNDSLAKEEGMVYQVWEDGEITLQKSGSLLGKRNLHCISPGWKDKAVPIDLFPHQTKTHGYMFTTDEGAEAVRNFILSL